MGNLVSSCKILVCENVGEYLTDGCFRETHFFFTPIMLDMFQDIADRVITRGVVILGEVLLCNWVGLKMQSFVVAI